MAVIASKQHRWEKKYGLKPFWKSDGSDAPLVSIIVPAYNEEVNAVSSLENLLRTDYPNFEIIFVDDGSKDDTFEKVNRPLREIQKCASSQKPMGARLCTELRYQVSEADFVICIDADTKLLSDAVSKLMMHFGDVQYHNGKKVGAVAGNVKVGNTVNLLTSWQSIEYISSQNFDRKAFAYVNAITVVPGAIGAFRKKPLKKPADSPPIHWPKIVI